MRNFLIITILILIFFTCGRKEDNVPGTVPPSTTPPTSTSITPVIITGKDDVDPVLEAAIASAPTLPFKLEDLSLPSGKTIGQFYKEHPDIKAADDADLKAWRSRFPARRAASLGEDLSTPTAQMESMVRRLTVKAERYCHILNYGWKAGDVGTGKPDQPYGLAYVYGGGRNYDPSEVRETPTSSCPKLLLYGADCSGFVYRVFTEAGFRITKNLSTDITANYMSSIGFWKDMIAVNLDQLYGVRVDYVNHLRFTGESTNPTRKLFNMADPILVDPKSYKPGDIIFWHKADKTASHMGIVLKDGNKLQIFQSNGTASANTSTSMLTCNKDYCTSNYLCESRGVHTKDLSWIPKVSKETIYMSIIRFSVDDESMSCKVDGQGISFNTGGCSAGLEILPNPLGGENLDLLFADANQSLYININGFDYDFMTYNNCDVTYKSKGETFTTTLYNKELVLTKIDGDMLEGTFDFAFNGSNPLKKKIFSDGKFRVKILTQY